MEHQEEHIHDDKTQTTTLSDDKATEKATVLKRTQRMLYESSFATSAITSSGHAFHSNHPPGFKPSSLDYRVNYEDGAASAAAIGSSAGSTLDKDKPVTTKPAKRNKPQQQKQQQEQTNSDNQQRQKQRGPSVATRARGNFGPPPHRIATLEDLEHMSEDQLYRLFMEDPDLYRSLMKSTDERRSSTMPPAGSRKPHSSRSAMSRRRFEDKEVPYVQWLILLLIVAVIIYQLRKAYSKPTNKKRVSVSAGAKAKGGKQRKDKTKKSGAPTKKFLPKEIAALEESLLTSTSEEEKPITNKASPAKRLVGNNKKKKVKTLTDSTKKQKKDLQKQINQKQNDNTPDRMVSTSDTSKRQNQQVGNITVAASNNDVEGDVDTWQTVAKPKGNKIDITNKSALAAKKEQIATPKDTMAGLVPENDGTQNSGLQMQTGPPNPPLPAQTIESIVTPSKTNGSRNTPLSGTAIKNVGEKNNANDEKENMQKEKAYSDSKTLRKDVKIDQGGTKKAERLENIASPDIETTDNDAELALQLQKEEEENLARAAISKSALTEDSWEEVTTKKKKGVRAQD